MPRIYRDFTWLEKMNGSGLEIRCSIRLSYGPSVRLV